MNKLTENLLVKHIWTLLLLPSLCFAEEAPIFPERPGFSDTTVITPMGRWLLEGGITRSRTSGANFTSVGELMLRYPVAENMEVRLFGVTYGFGDGNVDGFFDPSVGVKYRLKQAKGYNDLDVAFVGSTTLPMGDRDFRVDQMQPTLKVAWSFATQGGDTIGGNVGFSRLGEDSSEFDQYFASVYLAHPLNAKWTAIAEVWGLNKIGPGDDGAAYASLGGSYLVNPDTALDLRFGTGFNSRRDGYFFAAGFALRF